ncbi:MAG: hypothetical protein IPP32_02940 [Bacteroidetes bacterium]|nr:hypothetical protein [Bacteroidota bacterium]
MTSKNELNNWWQNLPIETQFKYGEKLEEHLAECAKIYIQERDPINTYYKIQQDHIVLKDALWGIPVDFGLDSHQSASNYENFIEEQSTILLNLALLTQEYFLEVQSLYSGKIPIALEILEEIFSEEDKK